MLFLVPVPVDAPVLVPPPEFPPVVPPLALELLDPPPPQAIRELQIIKPKVTNIFDRINTFHGQDHVRGANAHNVKIGFQENDT